MPGRGAFLGDGMEGTPLHLSSTNGAGQAGERGVFTPGDFYGYELGA